MGLVQVLFFTTVVHYQEIPPIKPTALAGAFHMTVAARFLLFAHHGYTLVTGEER
jgi:hypothetical protein